MLRFLFQVFVLKAYLILLYKCSENDDGLIRSFIKVPDETSYPLDITLKLTCKLKFIEKSKIVVFRKDKSMKSEGCNVFDTTKYEMECLTITENGEKYKVFIFTIKQIGWEDRGKWDCFYIQNIKSVNIEINVNPIFEQLRVVAEPLPNENAQNIDSWHPQIYRPMGRGSRTNPYNLRDGTTINITCQSSCSYPEITHKWMYKNLTYSNSALKAIKQKNDGKCVSETNKGMTATQSQVSINCSSMGIVGANIVTCSSSTMDSDGANSSVYILCPGGEWPWELTTGEIVGVALSVGMAVVLVTMVYTLIKRSRYASVSGNDGAKTFSSGLKL